MIALLARRDAEGFWRLPYLVSALANAPDTLFSLRNSIKACPRGRPAGRLSA
jgi:hypothetical protein